ncbi:hypothetical protein HN587_06570 [Candidatus Woesearchaeota archaeon]|jgi:Icc-related predicted phosphoesterase|nr:hypothetical protein [Candidatus Woesearchaeota archaeon]
MNKSILNKFFKNKFLRNKRGMLFNILLVIVTVVILSNAFVQLTHKKEFRDYNIGEQQMKQIQKIQAGEKAALCIDLASIVGVNQALFKLQEKGGTSGDCGEYYGFNLWHDKKGKDCSPTDKGVKEGMKKHFKEVFEKYYYFCPGDFVRQFVTTTEINDINSQATALGAGTPTSQTASANTVQQPLSLSGGLRFSVISDVHLPGGKKSLDAAFNSMKNLNPKPNLVWITGDLTNCNNHPSSGDKDFASIKESMQILESQGIPVFVVPGNHDLHEKSGKCRQLYTQTFAQFPTQLSVQNQDISKQPFYYSFDFQNSHFIGLNIASNSFSEEQAQWVTSDMQKAKTRGAQHVFVFFHVPPANPINQNSGFSKAGRKGVVYKGSSKNFMQIFSKFNAVIFVGHLHVNYLTKYKGVNIVYSGTSSNDRGNNIINVKGRRPPKSFYVVDVLNDQTSFSIPSGNNFDTPFDTTKHWLPLPERTDYAFEKFDYGSAPLVG